MSTHVQYVDNTVDVPQVQFIVRAVDIPVVQQRDGPEDRGDSRSAVLDKVVDMPIMVQRQVPMIQSVQKTVEDPQMQYMDKIVDASPSKLQKTVEVPSGGSPCRDATTSANNPKGTENSGSSEGQEREASADRSQACYTERENLVSVSSSTVRPVALMHYESEKNFRSVLEEQRQQFLSEAKSEKLKQEF